MLKPDEIHSLNRGLGVKCVVLRYTHRGTKKLLFTSALRKWEYSGSHANHHLSCCQVPAEVPPH